MRTYNYSKYICGPDYEESTYEDVKELYETLAIQGEQQREYSNKTIIGKVLHKISYEIDLMKKD